MRDKVSLCKPSLRLTSAQNCSTLEPSGAKRRIFFAWVQTAGVSTLSGVSGGFYPRKQFPSLRAKITGDCWNLTAGFAIAEQNQGPRRPSIRLFLHSLPLLAHPRTLQSALCESKRRPLQRRQTLAPPTPLPADDMRGSPAGMLPSDAFYLPQLHGGTNGNKLRDKTTVVHHWIR